MLDCMLKRNSPVKVYGVSPEGKSLWWERFMKQMDFKPEVKE